MNKNVILAALAISLFWGIAPVIYRFMMNEKDVPYYIILMFSCIVYITVVIIYVMTTKNLNKIYNDLSNTKPSHIIIIVITSFLALSLSNLLYLYAIKNTSSTTLVISITSLYPIVTLLVAWLILNERINIYFVIGLVMVLCGLWIMINSTSKDTRASAKPA